MTAITNRPGHLESGVHGPYPTEWWGRNPVDGDAGDWAKEPPGSRYTEIDDDGLPLVSLKRKNDKRDDDWGPLGCVHCITQHVEYTDFTDGGGTSGTLVLNQGIPAGALVHRVILTDVVGFTGDSSAAMEVGDGTDADRYTAAADFDVFTTVAALDGGAPQGVVIHTVAKNVTLTVTTATNFTDVEAGSFTIKLFYFL